MNVSVPVVQIYGIVQIKKIVQIKETCKKKLPCNKAAKLNTSPEKSVKKITSVCSKLVVVPPKSDAVAGRSPSR